MVLATPDVEYTVPSLREERETLVDIWTPMVIVEELTTTVINSEVIQEDDKKRRSQLDYVGKMSLARV